MAFMGASLAPESEKKHTAIDNVKIEMTEAATNFLALLPPDALEKATFPFEDEERLRWSNLPGNYRRVGLKMKELDDAQKKALHRLLLTALSQEGYLKAMQIMRLDEKIRQGHLENDNQKVASRYGEGMYWIVFFGEPAIGQNWGWKFEGHHFSLNLTVGTSGISVTPLFVGANPAILEEGAYAGLSTMSEEQENSWKLYRSFSDEQREQATLPGKMPDDILTRTGNEVHTQSFAGLPASEMQDYQKELLVKTAMGWIGNLRKELAEAEMEKIDQAGIDKLHFAWAGGGKPGEARYFRIHGPACIIELDNRSYEPNHIHSLWRSLEEDMGKAFVK